jgi:hypothetical protein
MIAGRAASVGKIALRSPYSAIWGRCRKSGLAYARFGAVGHLRGQNFCRFSGLVVRLIVIACQQGVDLGEGGIIVLDRLAGKLARFVGQGGGERTVCRA